MTKDEALRLALEALETLHDENMDYLTRNKLGGENNQCMVFAREAITAIKSALEAKDEPVQWGVDWGKDGNSVSIIKRLADGKIEVLAWEYSPHLPHRTWVGLDEKDFAAINQSCLTKLQAATGAESILKEKNT